MPRAGVEIQLYSFYSFGTRWGWVFEARLRLLYLREKDLIPFVVWAAGSV
jgi:hypothetical protein